MVDREDLLNRARHAYEVGRWKMAARVLAVVVPIAVLCGFVTDRPVACLVLAAVLGVTLIMLRWRSRRGVRIANIGLTAGLLPLAAGVFVSQIGMVYFPALCMGICIGSGLLAGAWAGYALRSAQSGAPDWLIAGAVAVVTALLGCLDLDRTAVVALVSALFASAVIASLLTKRALDSKPREST